MSMKAQILFLFSIYYFLDRKHSCYESTDRQILFNRQRTFQQSDQCRISRDRKGFIWIATENGLNKFDGTRFSIYRHNATDSTSLKNNLCTDIIRRQSR